MLENQAKPIYLGIGSNLGDRNRNIERAKFFLIENKIKILKSSNFYETFSWPNPKKPKFLNIVVKVKCSLSPRELIEKCKTIEKKLGRKKTARNDPRICDIDIIDFKGFESDKLINLPHPRMHKRNFVLFPLFEINKDWRHPTSKNTIKKLILSLPNRDIRSIKQI